MTAWSGVSPPNDPERAARMDTPDIGGWDDMLPEPGRHPLLKLIALNIPPVALLGAATHAGLLDRFVADLWLGIPCAFVLGWLVLAVVMLACGSRWADRVAADLIPLGLIGTVFGIVMALGSVSVADIATLDGTIEMAGWFIGGMATAFYTTLIGAVGHFWYGWLADLSR